MIFLREITENDINIINKYRNNRELVSLLGAPFRFINIETDQQWFQSYQISRNNNVRCVICLSETKEIIGVIYLLNIDWVVGSAQFSIFIGESKFRGKGIGKKATIELLNHAFNDLNLNRIQLRVLENNESAINLYKAVGFKEEGLLREVVIKNNEYQNMFIMSILKHEFKYHSL